MYLAANLAALVTGANLYEHIRHLFYTTMPVFVISLVLYTFLGKTSSGGAYVQSSSVQATLDTLASMYTFGAMSWLLLLPALIVVVGSIAKYPTVPTMLFSAAFAFVIGIFAQHFSFTDGVASLVNGFDVTRRVRDLWIIDFGVTLSERAAALYELPFDALALA